MPYLVRAEVEKPGSGTFKTEAETKRDAIKKARELRSQGLRVLIMDPKGELVDEQLSKVVPKDPTCPNCGQSMLLVREGPSSALCADPHVFECARCLVVLMTEDHETLSGVATSQ